jgi:hypothetical protein
MECGYWVLLLNHITGLYAARHLFWEAQISECEIPYCGVIMLYPVMHEIKHIGPAKAPFGTSAIRLPQTLAERHGAAGKQMPPHAAAPGRQQRAYLLSRGNT